MRDGNFLFHRNSFMIKKSFRSDYEGWKQKIKKLAFASLSHFVLEVTMRDGNHVLWIVKFKNQHYSFRSDYEGWKL